MDMMDQLLVIRFDYDKNSYFENYLLSSKNVILIFFLVRIAFFSNYKNISVIFSLVKTVFFVKL